MTHPDSTPYFDDPSDDPLDPALRALLAESDERPTLRPSRDLWPEIAARLDAPASARPAPGSAPAGARVLAFRAAARAERAHPRAPQRRWLAAAAVALVTVSSGVTYLAVRWPAAPATIATARPLPSVSDPDVADAAARRPSSEGVLSPAAPRDAAGEPRDGETRPARTLAATSARAPHASASDDDERHAARERPVLRSVVRPVDRTVPGAADYDREIAELRAVVAQRHGDLDSATVEVLARNLRIIDAAIAASRAALARDPHSPFLGEQLTRALGQKVDLLRTAALLPRT